MHMLVWKTTSIDILGRAFIANKIPSGKMIRWLTEVSDHGENPTGDIAKCCVCFYLFFK